MGMFTVKVGVCSARKGDVRYVDALVDTGASHSTFPESFLQELGIEKLGHPKPFETAHKELLDLYTGEARLIVKGETRTVPVAFGSADRYILGATALQNFGLIPDTTAEELIPLPKFIL